MPKFFQPDSQSSFGAFTIMVGPENLPLPFIGPSKVQILLGSLSTQQSAYVSVLAAGIELTDPTQFMDDLSKLPVFRPELSKKIAALVKALKK